MTGSMGTSLPSSMPSNTQIQSNMNSAINAGNDYYARVNDNLRKTIDSDFLDKIEKASGAIASKFESPNYDDIMPPMNNTFSKGPSASIPSGIDAWEHKPLNKDPMVDFTPKPIDFETMINVAHEEKQLGVASGSMQTKMFDVQKTETNKMPYLDNNNSFNIVDNFKNDSFKQNNFVNPTVPDSIIKNTLTQPRYEPPGSVDFYGNKPNMLNKPLIGTKPEYDFSLVDNVNSKNTYKSVQDINPMPKVNIDFPNTGPANFKLNEPKTVDFSTNYLNNQNDLTDIKPLGEIYGLPSSFEPAKKYGFGGPGNARTIYPGLVERTRPVHTHEPFGMHSHREYHSIFNEPFSKPILKFHDESKGGI